MGGEIGQSASEQNQRNQKPPWEAVNAWDRHISNGREKTNGEGQP
jgi:hypothetical protein